ncbi:hypothetical protein R6Q59_031388 [Mikania micrantha]
MGSHGCTNTTQDRPSKILTIMSSKHLSSSLFRWRTEGIVVIILNKAGGHSIGGGFVRWSFSTPDDTTQTQDLVVLGYHLLLWVRNPPILSCFWTVICLM